MGKKNKRKFIDKKHASRYTLMHRSQRDVGHDILLGDESDLNGTGMILWPDPSNNPETDRKVLLSSGNADGGKVDKMREWKDQLAHVGLLDDTTEQYLRPITGTGTFLSASGNVENPMQDPRSHPISEDLLAEINPQVEALDLRPDVVFDEEIQKALEGDFEEGDFEEIADDFVLEAAQEPVDHNSEAQFDFDAHIQKLMEDARRQAAGDYGPVAGHANPDEAFFAQGTALGAIGEDDDDDEDDSWLQTLPETPGVVPSLNPDEERALCEQFEQALAEYDSDELADLPEEDIHGDRSLQGDVQVEAALDEYLQDREDGFFMHGKTCQEIDAHNNNKQGGSGFSALVGTRMVPTKELDSDLEAPQLTSEPVRPFQEILQDAKRQIQSPELEPPPEEIFIDGKSYYSQKERNPWDCESILSTYSNLDNNPVTIGVTSNRKNKKKNKVAAQQQKIMLSNKTGLPVLLGSNNNNNPADEVDYDNDHNDQTTMVSVNKGLARQKKETPEEKRARKAQVKKERQQARIQKKVTKEVYKDEFLYRNTQGVTDDTAGKAVFRYS